MQHAYKKDQNCQYKERWHAWLQIIRRAADLKLDKFPFTRVCSAETYSKCVLVSSEAQLLLLESRNRCEGVQLEVLQIFILRENHRGLPQLS